MERGIVRVQLQDHVLAQRLSAFSLMTHSGFGFNLVNKIPSMFLKVM